MFTYIHALDPSLTHSSLSLSFLPHVPILYRQSTPEEVCNSFTLDHIDTLVKSIGSQL